ncbi:MAG: aldose 1-epimerase family protein [Planctomycetaceae bacterium]|nr:aldose 1-epimerase family protein [Planctomycetaceae bacterium]
MTHELINLDAGIHDTQSILTGSGGRTSIQMKRMSGGLSDGVDVVKVDNGRLALQLLPTRGMGIWKASIDGVPVQWNSPVRYPVNPAYVDPMRLGGIGWVDGFNELIVRCGLGWHGAPGKDCIRNAEGQIVAEPFLPLHGRIANLPANHLTASIDGETLSVTGTVDEGCLFGGWLRLTSTLKTNAGSGEFEIIDTVTNMAATPAETEILYHCNVGEPFLEENSVLHTAVKELAPRNARAAEGISMWNLYEGPKAGFAEQVYFADPAADSEGWAVSVLSNAESTHAFSVRHHTSTLPWFTLWKNTGAREDGYVTGLEPGSSFPNPRQIEREQGRLTVLQPGQSVTYRLKFEVATDRRRVREILDEVTSLQVATPRTVHSVPKEGWAS